ncbi:MAG: CBS domain-containing protein [Candidatus Omnitrophica bacterium]|nr:CBS domain-containing protein [Candidatus Omnitrophota bacterium]MCM8777042.1 CBS domain-containing protein [Candidatus Omnitrophota bacterium]
MKRVKDFMVGNLLVIKEQTSIKEIIEIFANSHHNILPVVNSAGKIIGLVSLEELLDDLLFSREDVSVLEKVSFLADFLTDTMEKVEYISPLVLAKDVMQTNVFTVKEDESMLKAAILMKKKNVHRLIVVNNENIPVGYVSRNEVCKAFLI